MQPIIKRTALAAGLAFVLLLAATPTAHAQKFAYVNTQEILEAMPEYNSAQKQLEAMSESWRKEIQRRIDEIDKLYKAYQTERPVLPETQRKEREKEIMQKEKELADYKRKKFGEDGELYKQRKRLIDPIQEKVFNAIQTVAKREGLDFILDKAGSASLLYTNAEYDRTLEVMDELGISERDGGQQDGPGGQEPGGRRGQGGRLPGGDR